MKFVKFILVIAVIGLILFGTNPTLANHEAAVDFTTKIDPAEIAKLREKGLPIGLDARGQKPIHYQNYRLFSTTTDDDGGRLSFGILKMVFDLRPSDQRPKR